MSEERMDEYMKEREAIEEDYVFTATIMCILAETTWGNSSAKEVGINYVYTENGTHFHRRPLYRDFLPSDDPWMNGFSLGSFITDRGYAITKDEKSMEINMGLSRGRLDKHDDEETNSIRKSIFEEFEKRLEAEGYLYTVL